MISAITNAEQKAHFPIGYFAPDPQLLKTLINSAQRGVEVILILPSYSNSCPVFNFGQSYNTKLLRGGVKIHERNGALMYAKTVCIDDVWPTIGSTNMDWRSFLHNDEINAVIFSREFAQQMNTMFASDLTESQEILLKNWQKRFLMNRLK